MYQLCTFTKKMKLTRFVAYLKILNTHENHVEIFIYIFDKDPFPQVLDRRYFG